MSGAQNTVNREKTYIKHETSQQQRSREDPKSLGGVGPVERIRSQHGTELLKRNTVSYVTMMEYLQDSEEKLFSTRKYILSQEQCTSKN